MTRQAASVYEGMLDNPQTGKTSVSSVASPAGIPSVPRRHPPDVGISLRLQFRPSGEIHSPSTRSPGRCYSDGTSNPLPRMIYGRIIAASVLKIVYREHFRGRKSAVVDAHFIDFAVPHGSCSVITFSNSEGHCPRI